MCNFFTKSELFFKIIRQIQGGRMSFFPVKHEKFPLSYIQDAKNFSVVKPLNSGEAVASLASPVPRPLLILNVDLNWIVFLIIYAMLTNMYSSELTSFSTAGKYH